MKLVSKEESKQEDILEDGFIDESASESESSEAAEAAEAAEVSSSTQQLSLVQLPHNLRDPFISNVLPYLPASALVSFSKACKQTSDWASNELEKCKASALLLAVVQGNEAKAKRMLENNSYLLYRKEGKATDYSGRHIQNLTVFQAALCAGDVEMCEMMKKDYFSQLEDGQAEIEKQFNEIFPNGIEACVQMQQDNAFDFDEILQAIIDAPEDEVTAALNKAFDNHRPLHSALEKFRKAFTEQSLSEIVFNPYHLLKAFERYTTKFDHLGKWGKRDLFWRQVFGFVQRNLPACYLQAFVQGIWYIIEDKKPLRRSFDFRLGGGTSRSGRDFSGLGFDFSYLSAGGIQTRVNMAGVLCGGQLFGDYVWSKNIKLGEITQPNPAVQARTWCVIL